MTDRSAVEILEIVPEPLSKETFKPFGTVLGKPEGAPYIDKGWLEYWHGLEPLGFSSTAVWGYLELKKRPLVVVEMERHCRSHEVFVPMQGTSVMAFATGDSSPDMSTIRLFEITGNSAFVVGRGIWHSLAYPIGETAGFLLALEEFIPDNDVDAKSVGPFEFRLRQTL